MFEAHQYFLHQGAVVIAPDHFHYANEDCRQAMDHGGIDPWPALPHGTSTVPAHGRLTP